MRVVKKINNNVAICMDSAEKELIAFGKGIGFPEMPYKITDLSQISMTFYKIDKSFYKMLEEVPEEIFEVSALIVDKVQETLNCNLNPNLVVSLADHIHFAMIRLKKYKIMKMFFSYDIEKLYPKETELGRYALQLIEEKLGVSFPESEITNIAMHFINAQEETDDEIEGLDTEMVISAVIDKIEAFFSISIDKKSFYYNRFIMHLRYYIKRIQQKEQIVDGSETLMLAMKAEVPKVYECARIISSFIDRKLHAESTEDEILYLMIHINRILKKQ